MIEPTPPRSGEPLRANWAQRLIAYVRSLRVSVGPGLLARRTSSGTVISLAPTVARSQTQSVSSDGAVIGIVQRNSSNDSMSSATETEVNENQLTVTLYPNWPSTTGSRTARLYTPCVYRRAPLMVGDPILCHPCAVAVTTEGEDS